MQSFIVLGLVPGTNIQFGFILWLIAFSIIGTILLVIFARNYKYLKEAYRIITARTPLPASQFHIRLK